LLFEVNPEPARGGHCFMKFGLGGDPVDKCCNCDTGELLLRCGKWLRGNEKGPENAVSDTLRP
jgi:hypothetical protein